MSCWGANLGPASWDVIDDKIAPSYRNETTYDWQGARDILAELDRVLTGRS
jgi:hypothetical protein